MNYYIDRKRMGIAEIFSSMHPIFSPSNDMNANDTVRLMCEQSFRTRAKIAAGINRKTFYSYYDGVESLFEEIETELINKFRPLFSTLNLKSTTFSARSFFSEFSELARDDFEIYHLLNQCGQLPHLLGKVQELVVDIIMSQVEVEIDDPHEKARLMLMSEYVAAGILSMVSHWIANPGDISLDEFLKK